MKWIYALVLSFSVMAFAKTESTQGNGYSSGYCRHDNFVRMCLSDRSQQAESGAERDAELQCRMKGGRLLTYTRHCSTNCHPPMYGPADGSNVYVTCQALCRYSCEIKSL